MIYDFFQLELLFINWKCKNLLPNIKNKYQNIDLKNTFLSTGLGMALETKLGLLNISYAIGKRDDVQFNLRGASKIHFGYVNYF